MHMQGGLEHDLLSQMCSWGRQKDGEKYGVRDLPLQFGIEASGKKWWCGSLYTIMISSQQLGMAGCDIRGQWGSDPTLNSPLRSGQINFPHFPKQGSDVSWRRQLRVNGAYICNPNTSVNHETEVFINAEISEEWQILWLPESRYSLSLTSHLNPHPIVITHSPGKEGHPKEKERR